MCLQNKNPQAMEEYQRKLAGIWKRHQCHPIKSILPILCQAPVFIGFFSSLQSLARAKVSLHLLQAPSRLPHEPLSHVQRAAHASDANTLCGIHLHVAVLLRFESAWESY